MYNWFNIWKFSFTLPNWSIKEKNYIVIPIDAANPFDKILHIIMLKKFLHTIMLKTIEKDSWTWTTVWWLLGGGSIRGLNCNGKNIIKIYILKIYK